MFLSDSSGSGQGFHAQIASISQLSKNKPSRGKNTSSKSRRHKNLRFTRVSNKPIKYKNATRATGWKDSHKKVTQVVTPTPALHKNISKPTTDHENSVFIINNKNPILETTNKSTSKNISSNIAKQNMSSRTSQEEALNIGHLKISMEIIDFNRNTSSPSNDSDLFT